MSQILSSLLVSEEMSTPLNKNKNMGSPFLREFKKQASFFFKEKIKIARLALTDVTAAELLTEEATSGDLWPPDTRMMGLISRAAFEVDDYWRIVDILHKRLMKFERKNWRVAYKALLLLEHLLTHGPLRVADEFQGDRDIIDAMGHFEYVDDGGFNWGLSVRNLSEKVLNLLEDGLLLEDERARARNLTRGIQGFGSFSRRASSEDGSFKSIGFRKPERCNSNYTMQQNREHETLNPNQEFSIEERNHEVGKIQGNDTPAPEIPEKTNGDGSIIEDHPFYNKDNNTKAHLLPK